ncbi:MAG: hypothetical protein IIA88_11500 [Bacteroidetes bacterium]|nr:hypothetical protein [Bacteroidota bacterium]
MLNNPELMNGKYLATITEDFVKVAGLIKEASYQIRKRKISHYPMFLISKAKIPIGKLLLDKDERMLTWHYSVSYLEEFTQKKIISDEGIVKFKKVYKNPDEFCCLFVVDRDFVNYIFVPYPEE